MVLDERELAINPIVPDSIQHNTRTIQNIRNLTGSLFGIAAGTLGLESYPGFLFYLFGSLIVSCLIFVLRAEGVKGGAGRFFNSQWSDLWFGEVGGSLMSYVLTWTLFYGIVRA